MDKLKGASLTTIGGMMYLIVGISYMLSRLFKVWGWTFLASTLLGWNLDGLSGFLNFFIYLAAAVYIVIALLGFSAGAKDKKSLGAVILGIGVIFGIIALVGVLRDAGFLNILKLIASLCYIVAGIRLKA